MKASTDRILTTHVGSLPRPDGLLALLEARAEGKPVDEEAYRAHVCKAVKDIVRRQAEIGIDVVADGEMGKPSFITYASERLSGLERRPGERPSPFAHTRETASFPEFYQSAIAQQVSSRRRRARIVCAGPIAYKGQTQLQAELANLKAALDGLDVVEAFVPAIAPSNIEATTPNEYYSSEEAYVFAIAEAMAEEYRAIVAAGFLLQIDDPFLVTYITSRAPTSTSSPAASGQNCGSRRSTMRSRASPRTRCASTPATASTWVRASTTWSSRTSSTSSCACVPVPIPSKPPIRATSTSGRCGRT
jgi:5-methyltetrahydropteroyltriglutamate--homocysteine methyltransferase